MDPPISCDHVHHLFMIMHTQYPNLKPHDTTLHGKLPNTIYCLHQCK